MGTSISLKGTYTDDGTFGNTLTYRWEHSLTGDAGNPTAWTTKTTATGTSPLNVTYPIPSVSTLDTGYYRLLVGTAASINQPNCRATSAIVRLRLDSTAFMAITFHDTICQNNAYSNYGFDIPASELQTAGTVERQYIIPSTTGGCDTIVKLKLNVTPQNKTNLTETICKGETYNFHGNLLTESDIYYDTLQNHFGCDSIVILNLKVVFQDTNQIFAEICDGEVYQKNGFTISVSGIYTQNLKNRFGCDSTVILNLTVKPTPQIEIIPLTDNFCNDDFIELEIRTDGKSFRWNTGSSENPLTVTKAGTYSATAFIENCEKTAKYVVEECPCVIWIPNAFTPNNDGINEVFRPIISCHETLKDYKLLIYNRWGNLIFQSFDYAVGWDGNDSKGGTCSEGIYTCRIEYTNSKNEKVVKNGEVVLFR